jgi:CRISPR-associated endonuclease Cas2
MKKGELIKKILLAAGVGVGIGTVMVVPSLAISLKAIIEAFENKHSLLLRNKKEKIDKTKVKRVLYNLEKRGLVSLKEINGDLLATFNKNGKKLVLRYKFDELEIKKPRKWDGKWRVVIFDIPEKKKLARDILREKLEKLGFYQLQKSVFIHPFECQQEIELISKIYEIEPFVYFMKANYIDNQRKLKEKFNLS